MAEPFLEVNDVAEVSEIIAPLMTENPQCGERVMSGRVEGAVPHHWYGLCLRTKMVILGVYPIEFNRKFWNFT